MKVCLNCNHQMPDEAKRCGNCGTLVNSDATGTSNKFKTAEDLNIKGGRKPKEHEYYEKKKMCPKCHKELSDGMRFCGDCGTPVVEEPEVPAEIFCIHCGQKSSSKASFCPNCGESLSVTPVNGKEKKAAKPPKEKKQRIKIVRPKIKKQLPKIDIAKFKNLLSKKTIAFGAIGVVAVAVLVIAISLIFGWKSNKNSVMYIKDGEIYLSDLKKNSEAWQLTSRLIDTRDMDDSDLAEEGFSIGNYMHMSENGKYIFFMDKLGDEVGINLYYREIGNQKEDAIKVASGVYNYTVNSSSTIVTYNDYDGDLYQYMVGKDIKEKVASDVVLFDVSDDGKTIWYFTDYDFTEDCGTLRVYRDGDSERIADDVHTCTMTDDGRILYLCDYNPNSYRGELREWKNGKTRKIEDDVTAVINENESEYKGMSSGDSYGYRW